MENEWKQLVSLFKRAIVTQKVKHLPLKSYMFGKEKIFLGSQIFKRFKISNILIQTVFGSDFSKVQEEGLIIKRFWKIYSDSFCNIGTIEKNIVP